MPNIFSYSHVRANLAKLLDEISFNNEILIIKRRNKENIAMISEKELEGLLETAHLLRSPKNAQRLLESIKRAQNDEIAPSSINDLKKELGFEK